jgi:hypothetical protein
MGTILFTFKDGKPDEGLYDHEGWVEFLDSATGGWSSSWGHEALGSPGHDPIRVRAGCDCGWRGPDLPWSAADDYPTEAQQEALQAVWMLQHAGPLRDALS